MFRSAEKWNISFAGCGFSSVYYLGALSCILERVPRLVQDASKICGASSGCLVAASLVVGIPIENFCAHVMSTAIEARKNKLGIFQPTFNLLQIVRDSLLTNLPEDAHIHASGKLCVSLTRASDGKNVLVSEFDSRDELIQVLVCSCFFPVYCGLVPPSYRGVRYVDGALSNNMPLFEQRNTITVSPFSGESDICPREGTFNFLEVHYGNVSIQVNTGNVHRVYTSFCPPEPEMLAEICHNGYMDALHFLKENGLLRTEYPCRGLVADWDTRKPACCKLGNELTNKNPPLNGQNPPQEQHWWLDRQVIQNLPVNIRKVLCEACRERHTGGSLFSQVIEFLPVKVVSYLLVPCTLLVELTFLLAKRLFTWAGDSYRQRQRGGATDTDSVVAERGSGSQSSGLELRNHRGENNVQPLTSTITPTSNKNLYKDINGNLNLLSPTPPQKATSSQYTSNKLRCGKATLNQR
ncbi:1-acylglycerol-3-phosphate O-acyltransferase Pnpla3-like isoform 1-T1 [Polymixia lowei]